MVEGPVRWLYGLQRFGVKLGLETIRSMLERLGHPESAFSSILVAGTNGKGSVAAMLDAMLSASGSRTGLFTSPHLVRPNERIRIAGSDIASADLCRHLEAVREIAAHPTFFEAATAAALAAFREAGVETAILEVGLGGRLDATNAVDPQVSIVVTVDLDHTDRLGTTLGEIAAEKAGVVRSGRPLVSGVRQDEARTVLRETCKTVSSPFLEARQLSRLHPSRGGRVSIETADALYRDLRIPLQGRHQVENACVALVALEAFARERGMRADPGAVERGLAAVRWPGRLQWVNGRPPLLLDGAHNPAAARALAEYLRESPGPPPVLLFGVMKDKDVARILDPLASSIEAIVLTRPGVDRAADPDDIARTVAYPHLRPEVVPDPSAGLERARRIAGPGGRVLVTGSLYLVGEILGLLEGAPVPGPVPM